MARIRTVKPEFFGDQKLSAVSRDARLTFIGILVQSDDYGVVKGHPSWLKNNIFPYDDIRLADFQKWLKELESSWCIIPFNRNGEDYYFIRKFEEHQKVDKPSQWKNPDPPENILECLPEYSPTTTRIVVPVNSKGNSKGKGKEDIPAPEKKLFLEAVKLSDDQHASLVKRFGEADTQKAIETLNNYKMSSGKKYTSDYHTILNWVMDKVRSGGSLNGPNRQPDKRDKNWHDREIDAEAARANALLRGES